MHVSVQSGLSPGKCAVATVALSAKMVCQTLRRLLIAHKGLFFFSSLHFYVFFQIERSQQTDHNKVAALSEDVQRICGY